MTHQGAGQAGCRMTDPIATLRAYLNANLKRHDGSSDEWDVLCSSNQYGDLDNILDLLPEVFAEVERLRISEKAARADHDAIDAYASAIVRAYEETDDDDRSHMPMDLERAIEEMRDSGRDEWWTMQRERAREAFRAATDVPTALSQCQADLAAMTAERDDLIERHGEVAERMVLAESDLAAARGALVTLVRASHIVTSRWADAEQWGEYHAAIRAAESLTASGGEGNQ